MTHSGTSIAHFGSSLSYGDLFALSWAVTWRLLFANVVLIPIVWMLQIAFGSPHLQRDAKEYAVLYAVLEWLLAWPFVLRRALAPQVLLPRLHTSGYDPARTLLRYWPTVLLGISADLLSVLPVVATVLVVHMAGWHWQSGLAVAILINLVRLCLTLPLLIRLLTREADHV